MDITIDQAIEHVRALYPYPQVFPDAASTIRKVARLLTTVVPQRGTLLDIGCGALDKTLVFQKLGYSCFGCDDFDDPWYRSETNLRPLLEAGVAAGIHIHKWDRNQEVPWDEESFDVVTLINVIEHIHESPRYILNFAGKYLKPGGTLIVAMPNSVNLRKRISVFLGDSNYTPVKGFYENEGTWRGHVREFTLKETCQIVDWNGFELLYKDTFHGMLNTRLENTVVKNLFKGLCFLNRNFRDSLLVGASKPYHWVERQAHVEDMDISLTESWIVKS